MPEPTLINEAFASGADIAPLVDRLEAALEGAPRTHALIALTTIILMLQYPDISQDQIYLGVRDISRYICLWLAGDDPSSDDEPIDKTKMN